MPLGGEGDQHSITGESKAKGVRACDRCVKKKVKCLNGGNGLLCDACRDTGGVECSFEERPPAKNKPPKGYVESLERRLEAMEAVLKSLSEKERIGEEGSLNQSDSSRRSTQSPAIESPEYDLGVDDPDEKLRKDLEDLTVQDERFFGRGSSIHLARSLGNFSPPGRSTIGFKPENTPSVVEEWLRADEVKRNHSSVYPLPPTELAQKLVKAYFKNINAVQPLLHYPSFKRAWDFKFVDSEASFRGLFFAVCALGSRFVNDSRLQKPQSYSKGYEYHIASLSNATPTAGVSTLFDMQSSCLNAIYLLGCSSPISTWSSIGNSLRRVIDVGAHRENRSRWNASPLEDQLRKRAVYVLFGLDRQISASLGRPLALQDEDLDLVPPIDISDGDLDEWNVKGAQTLPPPSLVPTPLSGVQCIIKLQRIMGRTMRLLYGTNRGLNSQKSSEAVCELDSQLNEWLQNVPSHLRWDPSAQDSKFLPQSVFIYSTYYSCQILIHRDFISPSRAKLHPFPSLAICSNAARSLSHLLDALRLRGDIGKAFWFAPFAAVTAGLVLLINVFADGSGGPNLTTSARVDVQRCFAVLKILAENTFIAQKIYGGFKILAGVATAGNSLDPTALSRKRLNEEDASPRSDASSSNELTSPPLKQSRQNFGGERDFRPLPLTTEDLSLLTFNGFETYNPNAASSDLPLPLPTALPLSTALPNIATVTESAPFNFNWNLYNNGPSTLSPGDESERLLKTFYQTGTLPIPSTPSATTTDQSSSFLLPSMPDTPQSRLSTTSSALESPSNILSEFGFNFDPNVPFDSTFGGSFDLESLTQPFQMPVDAFEF